MQKARSRKHPGLEKRQNRFHTTTDRPERHEHLLRVCSDKWATQLRNKATYTYATVSPHQNSLIVCFPPLSHPHHWAATMGAPNNRPCAISAARTTPVDGGPARRPQRASTPPPSRIHQGLSWTYPRGLYPCIISVSTSDTSRGRISKMHYEKRRRGYIYPVRQKHRDYIGSVSQI